MKRFVVFLTVIVTFFLYISPLATVADNTEIAENWKQVEYTKEEKDLIMEMKAMYQECIDLLDEGLEESFNGFDIKPNTSKTPLIPGKLNDKYALATTVYLNIIRVGIGLTKVEWSPEMTEAAQYKAALVQYNTGLGVNAGHNPAKPEGISDEFYDKAQLYMDSENLYMAGILSGDTLYSLVYAIDDWAGDRIVTGHRYNLINPKATHFGVGLVGNQAVHKFKNRHENKDIEVVAWPSGITMPESDNGGSRTVRFYNEIYKATDETTVTVKWLNTGKTWFFDSKEENIERQHELYILYEGRHVSFYDPSIKEARGEGNVLEITLTHLIGKSDTYTYRVVYEDVYEWEDTDTKEPPPKQPPELVKSEPSEQKVQLNGKEIAFDAYNIEGYNYFKLRDLAYVLSGTEKQFEVGWDEAKNAISLTSGKPYTIIGGEMVGKADGDKTPTLTTAKIYLDGEEVKFTAYNIDGNNYFKLRDVMQTFDIYVGYDENTKTIILDTSREYSE